VRTWKIEGRKKGPHYVYYTVQGYRMLRDHGHDSKLKKNAMELLSRALGRTGTHYFFLPQRPQNPINLSVQTASGMLVGKIIGSHQKPYFTTREELFPGDVLRLGYEDDDGHRIKRIGRYVPKNGRMYVESASKKRIAKGAPVFLTDRRESALDDLIADLNKELPQLRESSQHGDEFIPKLPAAIKEKARITDLTVYRKLPGWTVRGGIGLWLSADVIKKLSGKIKPRTWLWLPPVVWPENEKEINAHVALAVKKGARHFVLNAPWQIAFFKQRKDLHLWAGPFCNLANPLAIASMASMGFAGGIVSPELGKKDYLQLPRLSPIDLGIVIAGNWPLCISRSLAQGLEQGKAFSSPKGEDAWVTKYGPDYWVFPNWKIDLRTQKNLLQQAGFSLFVNLVEPLPKTVTLKKRQGLWNWNAELQ
jgi:putative protease